MILAFKAEFVDFLEREALCHRRGTEVLAHQGIGLE
jgi:hypothetical protein